MAKKKKLDAEQRAQLEYENLSCDPGELEDLANRLEIPEDGMLSDEDVWDEAWRRVTETTGSRMSRKKFVESHGATCRNWQFR
jgi:hypothetical protein